jgi:hypothetical protein
MVAPMTDQFDLFPSQPRVETVDPESVRAELSNLLATARAARDAAPWDRRTQRYHRTVFPQMARWLPDDEAKQLWFDFQLELDRIELLLAA